MICIGIDPGAKGAMCIFDTRAPKDLTFVDFNMEDYINKLRFIMATTPTEVGVSIYLEEVHSMPRQGVASTFKFGVRFGELLGMLQTLDAPYKLVRPQTWQKAIGVPAKSGKQGIYETVLPYSSDELLKGPKGGIKDGRCDALGIALYAKDNL